MLLLVIILWTALQFALRRNFGSLHYSIFHNCEKKCEQISRDQRANGFSFGPPQDKNEQDTIPLHYKG